MWYKKDWFTESKVFFANRFEKIEIQEEAILMPMMFMVSEDRLKLIHLVLKREIIWEEDDDYRIKKISKAKARINGKVFVASVDDYENYQYEEVYKHLELSDAITQRWYSLNNTYEEGIYQIDKYIKNGENIDEAIQKYIIDDVKYARIMNSQAFNKLDKKALIKDMIQRALREEMEYGYEDYAFYLSDRAPVFLYNIVTVYLQQNKIDKEEIEKYYFCMSILNPNFAYIYMEMCENLKI